MSIPSNIAQGHVRRTGHYLNHLDAARGSGAEIKAQIELATRLDFVDKARVEAVLTSVNEVTRLVHFLAADVQGSQRR